MRAVAAFDGLPVDDPASLVDVELEVPEPRPADLLVEVRAVSVNPVDVKRRVRGGPSSTPRVLGFDAAGTVVATGERVTGFAVGDEVYYAGDVTRQGSNAEYQAVDHRIVGHKPSSLSFAEAAALPLTGLTAWESLFDRLGLGHRSDGTLLVLGAAGGVGSVLVQLARLRTAVRVIGTASRPQSAQWATRLGAHAVVDHRDLVPRALEAAPDGVEWLFSPFSTGRIEEFARIVKPFGHIVAIDDGAPDLTPLKPRSIAWHWEFMFTRAAERTPDMAEQGRILEAIARHVEAGELMTTVSTVLDDFSAAGLRHAHALVESGRTIGKVVIARP